MPVKQIEILNAPSGSPGGTLYALWTVNLTKNVVGAHFIAKIVARLRFFQKVATSFVFCASFGRSTASRHYICARDISRTSKKITMQQILIDQISQNHGSVQSRFAEIVYFHYMVTTEMLVLLYIEISWNLIILMHRCKLFARPAREEFTRI